MSKTENWKILLTFRSFYFLILTAAGNVIAIRITHQNVSICIKKINQFVVL